MTVSQPCPGRVLRATVTFALRTVRRAARILRPPPRPDAYLGDHLAGQPSGAGCENRPFVMDPDA